MKTATVLWGIRQGNEDWQEEILSTIPENFEKIKILAAKDGFDRFRTAVIDFSTAPDFRKVINR